MILILRSSSLVFAITALYIMIFICGDSIYAQSRQASIDSLSIKLQSTITKEIEKKLSEERQLYERLLDKHVELVKQASELTQKSIDSNIQLSIKALVVIFAIGAIAYGFIFVRKLSEVRQQIEETFENRARKIVNSKLSALDDHVEKAVGGKLKDAEQRIRQINERLESLLADITAYKQRRFVWIFPGESSLAENEIKVLKEQGITNLVTLTLLPEQPIQIPDCDVIILSYQKSEHAYNLLESIVEKLRKRTDHVFLIIYTFNNGDPVRFDDKEWEIVKYYSWYQLASFPMTLISVAKTLVR